MKRISLIVAGVVLLASLGAALLRLSVPRHNPQTETPLSLAVARGDAAQVGKLIAAGADVNARDVDGLTPLMRAARAGEIEVARLLIAARADLNARDCAANGWTPLIHAIHKNQNEAARLLIDHGADVNARAGDCGEGKSESGATALLHAAGYDNSEIVRALLDRGADPRAVHDSTSVLARAVGGAWNIDRLTSGTCPTETVRVLLERAPDLTLGNGIWDRKSLFIARHKGCAEVVEMIERRESMLAANKAGKH